MSGAEMDRGDARRLVDEADVGDLEACPFCASTNLGYYEHMFAQDFSVICKLCGAEGPKRSNHEEAGRLWNKRARA